MEFRYAVEEETPLVFEFIKALASYEEMLDEVVATEEVLKEWIFDKKMAEVVFCEDNDTVVGFALFFHNFSTFLGRSGIYIEDLFVKPEYRGKGYGKGLLSFLAAEALQRGCGRLEWWCLDWNEPSIKFSLKMGAVAMDEWTVYRVSGENLSKLAEL
jgi:GNAT superfamily N-acetyltransferase